MKYNIETKKCKSFFALFSLLQVVNNIKQQSGRMAIMILQFAAIALIVGLHYLALKINWLVAGLIIPSAAVQFYLIKKIASYRWKDMRI